MFPFHASTHSWWQPASTSVHRSHPTTHGSISVRLHLHGTGAPSRHGWGCRLQRRRPCPRGRRLRRRPQGVLRLGDAGRTFQPHRGRGWGARRVPAHLGFFSGPSRVPGTTPGGMKGARRVILDRSMKPRGEVAIHDVGHPQGFDLVFFRQGAGRDVSCGRSRRDKSQQKGPAGSRQGPVVDGFTNGHERLGRQFAERLRTVERE